METLLYFITGIYVAFAGLVIGFCYGNKHVFVTVKRTGYQPQPTGKPEGDNPPSGGSSVMEPLKDGQCPFCKGYHPKIQKGKSVPRTNPKTNF
jgi:hypothetical protein